MTEQCAFCGTKDEPLHCCSGCRQRKYCNEACQRAAWRAGHNVECARLRAAASSASSSSSSASAAAASASASPGGEGGAPIIEPPSPAATSPDSSPRKSTPKKNKKKRSNPKTNNTNGPAALSAEQPAATKFKSKNKTGEKTMWVTVFKCFNCGKHGHDLVKCDRCEEAYYCDRKCQIAHVKVHAEVCVAAVAAKAQRAHRERIAGAMREEGKDKVEGGEEDELCVICQEEPMNAVKVSGSAVRVLETCASSLAPVLSTHGVYFLKWIIESSVNNNAYSHLMSLVSDSCRVVISTARIALRSCDKKGWTDRAPSAASRCRLGQRCSSTWVI